MVLECILKARNCINCGECMQCDMNPEKICDDCCECINNSDYRGIYIDEVLTIIEQDGKHFQQLKVEDDISEEE